LKLQLRSVSAKQSLDTDRISVGSALNLTVV
jgi:hypothetical protein